MPLPLLIGLVNQPWGFAVFPQLRPVQATHTLKPVEKNGGFRGKPTPNGEILDRSARVIGRVPCVLPCHETTESLVSAQISSDFSGLLGRGHWPDRSPSRPWSAHGSVPESAATVPPDGAVSWSAGVSALPLGDTSRLPPRERNVRGPSG